MHDRAAWTLARRCASSSRSSAKAASKTPRRSPACSSLYMHMSTLSILTPAHSEFPRTAGRMSAELYTESCGRTRAARRTGWRSSPSSSARPAAMSWLGLMALPWHVFHGRAASSSRAAGRCWRTGLSWRASQTRARFSTLCSRSVIARHHLSLIGAVHRGAARHAGHAHRHGLLRRNATAAEPRRASGRVCGCCANTPILVRR